MEEIIDTYQQVKDTTTCVEEDMIETAIENTNMFGINTPELEDTGEMNLTAEMEEIPEENPDRNTPITNNQPREVEINPEDYEVPQEPNPLQIAPSINRVRRMNRPTLSINRTINRNIRIRTTQVRHPSRQQGFSRRGYLMGRTFNKSNFYFSMGILTNFWIGMVIAANILSYEVPEGTEGYIIHDVDMRMREVMKTVILIKALEILFSSVDIYHFRSSRIYIRNYNYWYLIQKLVISIFFYISLKYNWKHIYIAAAIADLISYITFFLVFVSKFMRFRNSPCFLPMILWPAINGSSQIMICLRIAGIIHSWNYVLIPIYVLASAALVLGLGFFIELRKLFYDKYDIFRGVLFIVAGSLTLICIPKLNIYEKTGRYRYFITFVLFMDFIVYVYCAINVIWCFKTRTPFIFVKSFRIRDCHGLYRYKEQIKSALVDRVLVKDKSLIQKLKRIGDNLFCYADPEKDEKLQQNEDGSEEDLTEPLCYICYRNVSGIVNFPCLHTGLCMICGFHAYIEKSKCPMCRKSIEKLIAYEKCEEGEGYQQVGPEEVPDSVKKKLLNHYFI